MESSVEHQVWDDLLESMSSGGSDYPPGGSPTMLAKVLTRAVLANGPVPRSEISKGSMLIRQKPLASGTVGKAVEALIGRELLTAEDKKTGQPGPPITPLRLGDKWAIVGIHIDQQHEGPDRLTGIICGLDRKPIQEPLTVEVPGRDGPLDQDDARDLAGHVGKLTGALLADLDGSRTFLGVGVGIGGHVHHGIVRDSVHAGWPPDVELQRLLNDEFRKLPQLRGVPAVVENDGNALAIHGYYDGSFKGLDVALVTVFRQGVGGALILNGRMYRGFGGMAPEPGHIPVEYPEDHPAWTRPPTPVTVAGRAFRDECLCSTPGRKHYGHLDTLATPARIEGQLAALKQPGGSNREAISLEEAAAAPLAIRAEGSGETLVFSLEATVLRRAGRALGRAVAELINILNPGELVLRLPLALAQPAPQTSGGEYLDAVEREVNGASSTGPADARRGDRHLSVQCYADDEEAARDGAVAAATTVFNAFVEHARGRDGCSATRDRSPVVAVGARPLADRRLA
jgi:predicted NBD/HSP70 family sugar kinase